MPDKENRGKDDFYPTPPQAVTALLSVEEFDGGKMVPYAWFIFDPEHQGPPTLGWLNSKDFI